jgi:hypothetical protein
VTEDAPQTERVGQFDLSVVCAEPSPEAAELWARRAEALVAWLLAEWQREQRPGPHQGGDADRE